MNKDDLEQKIKSLLARIADHSNNSDINNKVEMDALFEDIGELQETIVILRHINTTEIPGATTVEEPEETEEADTVPDLSTDESSIAKAKDEAEAKVEEPTTEIEPLVENLKEEGKQDKNTTVEDSAQEEDQEQTEPEAETLSDSTSTEEQPSVHEQSINDQIESRSEANSVANRLESQPIANLSLAIGINERFLFTKELFNDDSQAYSAAIEKLNEFQSLDEARSYIESELKDTYNWEDESEAAEALTNLVEKRHSS